MKKTKKTTPRTAQKPVASTLESPGFRLGTSSLLILTFLTAGFYFIYSFAADGFYQQDEAAHFLNMRQFWFEPHRILGNWAKPGYKLIYAFPALLGPGVVTLFNALVSAFTAFFAYKTAEVLGSKIPLLAFALLAAQPLWINLSFRNYSELLSTLLLISAAYFHFKDKKLPAALLLSYLLFIRQEFIPFAGLYFLYLAYHRKFLPAAALAVFPLIQNIWGWILKGEPLYLLNQILNKSSKIADAWPRQGFDHYFLMSEVIFGGVVLILFLIYLLSRLTEKKAFNWFLLVPAVGYFLMHALFNWQGVPIGPSTGGNLRYLVIIAPLLAVMGTIAAETLPGIKNRLPFIGLLSVFGILVAVYMTYEHNLVKFFDGTDGRPVLPDNRPLIGIIIASIVALIPMKRRQYAMIFSGLILFSSLLVVRPIKRSAEDAKCSELADWLKEYQVKNGETEMLLNHTMLFYFLNKTDSEFRIHPPFINEENLKQLPVGSLIIWDTHYSYRPELRDNDLELSYFSDKHLGEYKFLHKTEARLPDGRMMFAALVLQKVK